MLYHQPTKTHDRRRGRKGGIQSAELLIVLPILLLVVFMMVQMGTFFMHQHRLQAAVDLACRTAAVQSGDAEARCDAARYQFYKALDQVAWSDDCNLLIDLGQFAGDSVTVSVEVPTRKVLPDLLKFVGLGLSEDERMRATAFMPQA